MNAASHRASDHITDMRPAPVIPIRPERDPPDLVPAAPQTAPAAQQIAGLESEVTSLRALSDRLVLVLEEAQAERDELLFLLQDATVALQHHADALSPPPDYIS